MLVSGSVAQGVCDKGRCVCGGGGVEAWRWNH